MWLPWQLSHDISKPHGEQGFGRAPPWAAGTLQLSVQGYTTTCPSALLRGKSPRRSPQLHSSASDLLLFLSYHHENAIIQNSLLS